MKKYLLNIEFRYSKVPEKEFLHSSTSDTITIGVYDSFNEACERGNKTLELLERKFPLHVFPNGTVAPRQRLSENGGAYGSRKWLISNLGYIKTPFTFYIKITTLTYDDIDYKVDQIVRDTKEYMKWSTVNY